MRNGPKPWRRPRAGRPPAQSLDDEFDGSKELLSKRFSRAKARWLRRVTYSGARPIEKNLAYVVADHANCVTEDAWPSQETISQLLFCSTKTVRRAIEGLQKRQLLTVRRVSAKGATPRYAPNFISDDWDSRGLDLRHDWPEEVDTVVLESSLPIRSNEPSPRASQAGELKSYRNSRYRRSERGKWEAELVKMLGPNGLDILSRLAMVNERIVENLCRAICDGEIDQRELLAAQLAAEQLPVRWVGSRGYRPHTPSTEPVQPAESDRSAIISGSPGGLHAETITDTRPASEATCSSDQTAGEAYR